MASRIGIGLGLILALARTGAAAAEPARPAPATVAAPSTELSIGALSAAASASAPAPTAAPVPEPAAPARPPAEAARKPVAPPQPVQVSNDPRPTYGPDTFVATMRAAERYRDIAEAGGWPALASGAELKSGAHGPDVPLLRRRLALTGDLAVDAAPGDVFDAPLAEAVRRFQDRHGLEITGSVGPLTLAALNVPAETRARQLSASAARLMGSTFAFGERYVAVNIPSATVEAVEHGSVARRYVAVVGKPDRPSPIIATRIAAINFNPTWTVPVSLIRKDIIPHMRKDPGFLAKMKIRLLDGQGQEVDPARVNWSTEQAVNYTIRQDPGSANSLGDVRIDMPNRLAVYMHDTPAKRLFARQVRFESSGCVRVAGVHDLVAWLLDTTPVPPAAPATAIPIMTGAAPAGGTMVPATAPPPAAAAFTRADVEAAIKSGRREDVKLARPVPVAWVYLTGYATSDGIVHFRDDPYGLDAPRAPVEPVAELAKAAEPPTIESLVTGSLAPR